MLAIVPRQLFGHSALVLFTKSTWIEYADDFTAFCESKEDAERVVETLKTWLKQRGLKLSPEKTKIVHLSKFIA
ncbi:reverse transcriptase domain-containing protein [Nostoc sp. UHCC 0251]|uniref:reverse transcriptase domain-containing protein n=1 Tax=Nostoc sp. UHCC 0251 TaxID=3110240 RepID=UPI002B21F953|nr:reverse transcriptase domain-containing protein [Nostoc sp. UHCC 0251]MEA5624002.1 reverse transcriptase domain-containing protein [Nostoc sp. UHCC 0251]